jgi:hypothetical protein
MPSVHRLPTFEQRHSIAEFIQIRRGMLRGARSLPPGADRNQRRQIALSLRALFKNKDWLDAHTWEGAALLADYPSPSLMKEKSGSSTTNPQHHRPGCTGCGSPMILANIGPGETGYDLRTFHCPRCKRSQRYVIKSNVTETWLAPRTN